MDRHAAILSDGRRKGDKPRNRAKRPAAAADLRAAVQPTAYHPEEHRPRGVRNNRDLRRAARLPSCGQSVLDTQGCPCPRRFPAGTCRGTTRHIARTARSFRLRNRADPALRHSCRQRTRHEQRFGSHRARSAQRLLRSCLEQERDRLPHVGTGADAHHGRRMARPVRRSARRSEDAADGARILPEPHRALVAQRPLYAE